MLSKSRQNPAFPSKKREGKKAKFISKMKLITIVSFSLVLAGCLGNNNQYGSIPKSPTDIKIDEVIQQCGPAKERIAAGANREEYMACANQHGADKKVTDYLAMMWDSAVYLNKNRIQTTCFKTFSASSNDVESCMHGCEIPTTTCIANTNPMTEERFACLQQDQDCKRSCAIAGRQTQQVTVPCSN